MALKERINDDLKTALLSGNRLTCEVLRGLKAAILNQEVAEGSRESGLADDKIEKIIAGEIKKRREAAEIYRSADRLELANKELAEVEIMQPYLPKQLAQSEIEQLIRQVVESDELDLVPQNVGRIIGAVKQRAGTSAEGSLVAQVVQSLIK